MAYLGTKPANQVIDSTLIADGTITTSDLADNSITTAKIAAGAVVQADLATGVAGTGPAFSAYASAAQTVNATTATKLQFQTKEYDTATCYSTSTYRFTPNVAGYYQINGGYVLNTTNTYCQLFLYKNGSNNKYLFTGFSSTQGGAFGSCLVYLNGTTDYVELYAYIGATNEMASGNNTYTYFQGSMVRAA